MDEPLPRVTVVMACRNGAAHLGEQLASLAGQRGVEWRLIAGDDGSSDGTGALLTAFAARWPGRVRLVAGPGRGATAHFLALIRLAAAEGAEVLALADQDDVWLPGKLEEAVRALAVLGERPGLFVARVALWHGKAAPRPSRRVELQPGFRHALVQNIGPGHAMVVNGAALALLTRAGGALEAADLAPVWHDWWVYQVVSGAGGAVVQGDEVQVWYRQHGGNLVGQATGLRGWARRLARALSGAARADLRAQWAALRAGDAVMTDDARQVMADLALLPTAGPGRAKGLWRLGLARRGALGRVTVAVAGGMGWL